MARILIVDDERRFRDLARSQLGGAGHNVHAVSNAAEALEILESCEFDVVVSDVEMPYMDGLELARAIRARPKTAGLPVVLLTGRRAASVWREATRLGIRQYLVKPARGETLLREIEFALAATPMPLSPIA
jgi:CheY-like chemotaxis protein